MDKEFGKIFNTFSSAISYIFTTITTILGVEWFFFAGYLMLNILDYLTGTIKSKLNKTESSRKGLIGIIKKLCYWILIALAFLISFLLMQIGEKLNINIDFIMFFGWFTLACLIINEVRSILENLIDIGINVPSFLVKGLEVYSKLLDNKINLSTTELKK